MPTACALAFWVSVAAAQVVPGDPSSSAPPDSPAPPGLYAPRCAGGKSDGDPRRSRAKLPACAAGDHPAPRTLRAPVWPGDRAAVAASRVRTAALRKSRSRSVGRSGGTSHRADDRPGDRPGLADQPGTAGPGDGNLQGPGRRAHRRVAGEPLDLHGLCAVPDDLRRHRGRPDAVRCQHHPSARPES